MSCRRRSHRYSSYLDNRLLDDYRYNYRRSRSSRPYTAPSYDPYYNNYPTTTYRSLPPVSPAPYVTPVYETYERRPHTTYVPTAPIAPGPYPTTTYEPSYYRTLESPYRRNELGFIDMFCLMNLNRRVTVVGTLLDFIEFTDFDSCQFKKTAIHNAFTGIIH
uniref:Uncharacterized protein n=1 Tax=Trichobilharzia regenti TaxID=157069 RepID=A0AA85JHI7_TRIRE|nr:unnamed protein product [Trichobilharzia regenti]